MSETSLVGFTPTSRSMRKLDVDALSACVRSFKTVPQRGANDRVVVEPRSVSSSIFGKRS